MVPDLALACPRCAAALRPGAPWCTQCFLDIRLPEPEPESAPLTIEGEAEPVAAPVTGPVLEGAQWPCTACRTVNPLAATSCAGCGAGFLDGAHVGRLVPVALHVVGDLTRLSSAQRMGLAAAVVVLVMLLTALLGLLTG